MCICCDYCVYHYKSTELVSLYTLDIGLKINIIIIITNIFVHMFIATLALPLPQGIATCWTCNVRLLSKSRDS